MALPARFAYLHEGIECNDITNKNKDFIVFSSFTVALLPAG